MSTNEDNDIEMVELGAMRKQSLPNNFVVDSEYSDGLFDGILLSVLT